MIEQQISATLYSKVEEFATWFLRPGFYTDVGLWFDRTLLTDEMELAGAPYPTAFPNVAFPPKDHPEYSSKIYLEVRHFRNTNVSSEWGTGRDLMGILQISVVDPLQAGELTALGIASLIVEYFKKNTNLWTEGMERILIYESPTVLTMVQDGNKSIHPVSIPYRVYQTA